MVPKSGWGPGVDRELLSGADNESVARARIGELERMLDAAVDGLVTFDDDGRIRFASDGLASLLDRKPEALVGSPADTLLGASPVADGFDVTSAEEFRARLRDAGSDSDFDAPFEGTDGTVVPVTLSTVPLEERNGTACLVRDRQTTAGRDRQFTRYREAIHAAGDPTYALDSDGTIEWVNDATAEYTGYDREVLLGCDAGSLVPARDYERVTQCLLDLAQSEQKAETLEVTVLTSDGQSILTEAKLIALTDKEGVFDGSVGLLRDITDRKERERELERLKQVLTRVFRHNVRNELTVIQGHAELVRLSDDEALTKHADAIIQSTERLFDHSEKARLIERVLETESLVEVDISRAVDEALRSITWAHPEATIDANVPAETTVEAHPELSKAIEELLENAIVHAPPDTEPRVEVWLREREDHHTLYVEDESGGLADHELEVLWEGTETDLEHGSGVGLWLVYWLVEASEADLLTDRTGQGTVMGIRFCPS